MKHNADSRPADHPTGQASRIGNDHYNAYCPDSFADLLWLIATMKVDSLHNGWRNSESGPCCPECRIRPRDLDGRADALKSACGCRNPFQLSTKCECHIPTRKAVREAVNSRLDFVLKILEAFRDK